jgi:adenylate cyclase
MFKSTYFYRSVVSIIIALFFLGHTIEKIEIPLLDKVNNILYDFRLSQTTVNTVDPRIVILDIDEKSLAQEGRWPWSRDKLSYLVDILFDYYQIKVLGFDMVFAEPDTSSGLNLLEKLGQNQLAQNEQYQTVIESIKPQLNYDLAFANSLQNRSVVMGYVFNNEKTTPSDSLLPKHASTLSLQPSLNLFESSSYSANLAVIQNAAKSAGYFNNVTVDSDGSFRRVPLLMSFQDKVYESLSLAMLRKFYDDIPLGFQFGEGYVDGARLEAIRVATSNIPVTSQAVALVPYRGPYGSFEYISVTDVLNGIIEPETLNGKLVLLGTSAAGLLDMRTTPVGKVFPGVEVHANLLSGMLDNSFKSRPEFVLAIEFIALSILSALIILLYPRLSSISSAVMFALLLSIIVSTNFYLWQHLKLDTFLATPILLLFILFSVQLFFGYFLETRKRNKLGRIFGQYIPAELVSDMSKTEHDYSLKGESKEMTVLFSDVRGFTTISENLSPEDLCVLINEVLTPITHVIHQNHGTIDKYIGDAVMAFWGAPLDNGNHALDAVKAALAFKPVIEQINKEFEPKGWPRIDLGIGLNTGPMNVGNMGSEFRMAYTVMGDSVNLGSRLEGLTKQYGCDIIVSEFTQQQTPEVAYLELDRVRVKGKLEPVTIYEPIALYDTLTQEQQTMMRKHKEVLDLYYQREWTLALEILSNLITLFPDKKLFTIYQSRVQEYQQNPPDKNWDGVFTHLSK